jgi:arylsulfatase A
MSPLFRHLVYSVPVLPVIGMISLLTVASGSPEAAPPNVIVILADDMGYGDLSCYNPNSKITTPHMDQMAAQGVRFTDAHTSSSVCTPTRYSLLTGRYNWRTRLKSGVLDGFSPPLIEADRPTIASFLKRAGYDTACIGKWHLGMQWTRKDGALEDKDRRDGPGFRSGTDIDLSRPITGGPLAVGFDSYYGISASLDMPPYCWIENDRVVGAGADVGLMKENRELFLSTTPGVIAKGFELDEVLPKLKEKTVTWISEHLSKKTDTPFFLYLPLNSPHLPVVPSREFNGKSSIGLYGDFVLETDDFVGAVMAVLKRHGALENTLVILTSDNGGMWHAWNPEEADDVASYKPTPRAEYNRNAGHQSNGDLRGTKADIWEGGHRVPFIVQWPAKISSGVAKAPVEVTDIFATVAEIVGQPLQAKDAPDSFSFRSVLMQPDLAASSRPFLVHHSTRGVFSIREGSWKYVPSRGSGGFTLPAMVKPKADEATGQLYDLASDFKETKNLFLEQPQKVAHFEALLAKVKNSKALRLETQNPSAGTGGDGN